MITLPKAVDREKDQNRRGFVSLDKATHATLLEWKKRSGVSMSSIIARLVAQGVKIK